MMYGEPYVWCCNCGTMRPREAVHDDRGFCRDRLWCEAQAVRADRVAKEVAEEFERLNRNPMQRQLEVFAQRYEVSKASARTYYAENREQILNKKMAKKGRQRATNRKCAHCGGDSGVRKFCSRPCAMKWHHKQSGAKRMREYRARKAKR
jgi:hypothetical protein